MEERAGVCMIGPSGSRWQQWKVKAEPVTLCYHLLSIQRAGPRLPTLHAHRSRPRGVCIESSPGSSHSVPVREQPHSRVKDGKEGPMLRME